MSAHFSLPSGTLRGVFPRSPSLSGNHDPEQVQTLKLKVGHKSRSGKPLPASKRVRSAETLEKTGQIGTQCVTEVAAFLDKNGG